MRTRAVVVLAALAAVLAGCASVPTAGPIRSGDAAGDVGDSGFAVQAGSSPRPGAGAGTIVNDFLDAMATSNVETLKQYLTPEAAGSWKPDGSVTVFDRSDRQSIQDQHIAGPGAQVSLEAPEVATLDSRGAWRSAGRGEPQVTFTFKLVRVAGQLRISNAPRNRLVAADLFVINYKLKNLYFFTPKFDALVPDPVYLPERESAAQTATILAQAVLSGPTSRLRDSVLSAAPRDTEAVSVTVERDGDGVATVALNDKVAALGPDLRLKLAAQLAWTLRQAPGVLKIKLTAGGQPFEVDGTTSELPVTRWDSYDAAFASRTGRQLYMLGPTAIGLVDNIDTTQQQKPSIATIYGLGKTAAIESLAVDIDGQNAAAVTPDGIRYGPIGSDPQQREAIGMIPTDGKVLRPSFDKDGNLWIVDRTDRAQGARIRVRRENGTVLSVTAPGLEDRRITALRVARDGVRVLAVVQVGARSQLYVGRITGNDSAERIADLQPLQLGFDEIAAAGWSRPTKITVLGRTGGRPYQLIEVNIDGSEPATIQGSGIPDFNPRELAVAPDGDALPAVVNGNGALLVRERDLSWLKVDRAFDANDRERVVAGHPVYPG